MNMEPYKIDVDQTVLDDLQKRLRRTRWTNQDEDIGWEHGTNLSYLKEFTSYWLNNYNWRSEEARLNSFSWYTADISGQNVKFIYEKSKGRSSLPILLLHGWPDSVMRYLKLVPMLTDPEKFGFSADQSFDVVVPSFIGGFSETSQPPSEHEIGDMAETCWQLMTQVLGYDKFIAGGGDGGSPIAQCIGVSHPESILGLHLTDIGWHTSMRDKSDLSESEIQHLQSLEYMGFSEGAYAMVQGTIPQTLGLGLNDSPVGMAAWIIEKFRSWSDCNGDLESIYTKDELITNIMLYWLKNSVKSFSYKEEFVNMSLKPDQEVNVPVALAFPPNDLGKDITPREFAERNLKDIRRWNVLEKGGHFVAMEYPGLMASDLLAFSKEVVV